MRVILAHIDFLVTDTATCADLQMLCDSNINSMTVMQTCNENSWGRGFHLSKVT